MMINLNELRTALEKASYADIDPVTGSTEHS